MNIKMSGSASVTIDGKTFTGTNINIENGKVIVDGKKQDGDLVGDINVTVEGDVKELRNGSGKVIAKNVGTLSTGSGNVSCVDVKGSVSTGSGNVNCREVGGSVRTGSGNINRK